MDASNISGNNKVSSMSLVRQQLLLPKNNSSNEECIGEDKKIVDFIFDVKKLNSEGFL